MQFRRTGMSGNKADFIMGLLLKFVNCREVPFPKHDFPHALYIFQRSRRDAGFSFNVA